MHVDRSFGKPKNGYRGIELSDRLKVLIDAKSAKFYSRDACLEELLQFEREIRRDVPQVADLQVLLELRAHNPTIFQVVEEAGSQRIVGFNAQIPLTRAGFSAVTSGNFSPSEPSLRHVAKPDEEVDGIYVWLTFSPRNFVATVAGLSDYLCKFAPNGCSLFCTPVSDKVKAFLLGCGYIDARGFYPDAAPGLLFAPQDRRAWGNCPDVEYEKPGQIEVDVARTLNEIAQVIAVRAATYMSEQECPFDEEFDGNDFSCTHLVGRIGGEPAGCIRIRYFAEFVKFERLAVRSEFRKSRLAFRLVREAMRFAARKGYKQVYGHSRHDLVRFWETFGFRTVPDRPPFSFSDVEYVEMQGELRPEGDCLGIGQSPHRLIRPEGKWDEPGVLERSIDPDRRLRIQDRLSRRVPVEEMAGE